MALGAAEEQGLDVGEEEGGGWNAADEEEGDGWGAAEDGLF